MNKPTALRPVDLRHLGRFLPLSDRAAKAASEVAKILETKGPAAFGRDPVPGHITGSGFVFSADRTRTLLLHHRKLDRWLQPGGHCDGETDPLAVARREVGEETGLTGLPEIVTRIVDIDVHTIPARGDVPEHLHYDLRYAFEADPDMPLVINSESLGLAWVELEDLEQYTSEPAVLAIRDVAEALPRGPVLSDIETLFIYDGPRIAIIGDGEDLWITSSSRDGVDGMEFHVTRISAEERAALTAGTLSLRGAYAQKPWRRVLLDDAGYRFLKGGGDFLTERQLPDAGLGLAFDAEGLPDRMPDANPTP